MAMYPNVLHEQIAALENGMKAMIERHRQIQKALITREQYWICNEYARLNEARQIENESRWLENPRRIIWEYHKLESIDLWVDGEVDEEMGPSPLLEWPEIAKRWYDLQDRAAALMRQWAQQDAAFEEIFDKLYYKLQPPDRGCQNKGQDWSRFLESGQNIFRQYFRTADAEAEKEARFTEERQKLADRSKEIKEMLKTFEDHSELQISDFNNLHTRDGRLLALNRYLKRWSGKTYPQESAYNGSVSAGITHDLVKMVGKAILRWLEEGEFEARQEASRSSKSIKVEAD